MLFLNVIVFLVLLFFPSISVSSQDPMDLKLLYAASNGTTDDILKLLSQGYDVNQQQFRQQKNHMSCELTNLKRELQRGETIHPESHNVDSAYKLCSGFLKNCLLCRWL